MRSLIFLTLFSFTLHAQLDIKQTCEKLGIVDYKENENDRMGQIGIGWIALGSPDIKVRREVFYDHIEAFGTHYTGYYRELGVYRRDDNILWMRSKFYTTLQSFADKKNKNLEQLRKINSTIPWHELKSFDLLSYESELLKHNTTLIDPQKVSKLFSVLCLTSDCSQQSAKIVNWTNPRNLLADPFEGTIKWCQYCTATLPDKIYSFMTEKKYFQGLKLASDKMLKHIIELENGEIPKYPFDLWNDIYSSFLQFHPKEEAEKLSWEILGLYGGHGAATSSFIDLMDTFNSNAYLINIISFGLSYLDILQYKNNLPLYSIPKTVKTACLIGKPYHFWLSAYLSNRLVREDRELPSSSKNANDIVSYFYELASPTTGRSINRTLDKAEVLNRNSQRIYLALKFAGGHYGANFSTSHIRPSNTLMDQAIQISYGKEEKFINSDKEVDTMCRGRFSKTLMPSEITNVYKAHPLALMHCILRMKNVFAIDEMREIFK